MSDRSHYTSFRGGIDLISPSSEVDPGALVFVMNYECPIEGGYRAIDGYARIGDEVPGEGPILGVVTYDDKIHAIRKDVGFVTATMYAWSGSAWAAVGTGMPAGRYTFDVAAFKALSSSRELFMQCDNAAAKPWRYNGIACTEISAAPAGGKFVKAHAFHLFVAFEDGSLQWSEIGTPTGWSALSGAGELGVSDNITGMSSTAGGVLIVFCRDSIHTLYGTGAANFELKRLTSGAGAKAYTIADMAVPYFVGDRGMTSLAAVQEFGDFRAGEWGRFVEPLFVRGFTPQAVAVSKRKNQYRVFDASGRGVYATVVKDQTVGITLVQFAHDVACCHSGEYDDGTEVLLFGSPDGRVYQMDTTNSFDGEDIFSVLTTAFNHMRAPTVRKRFRRIYLDIQPADEVPIIVEPDFDGGDPLIAKHRNQALTTPPAGGRWDLADWDAFSWDGVLFTRQGMSITASATSIGLTISNVRNGQPPFSVTGYTTHYSPRRLRRD